MTIIEQRNSTDKKSTKDKKNDKQTYVISPSKLSMDDCVNDFEDANDN